MGVATHETQSEISPNSCLLQSDSKMRYDERMQKLIIANWKMNPERKSRAVALAQAVARGVQNTKKTEVVVCPPSVFLEPVAKAIGQNKKIILGAQDCAWGNSGPHTGSVSPAMLRDAGARYVILGHSERRRDYGETDYMVGAKSAAAIAAGLIPVICIGEWTRKGKSISQIQGTVKKQLAGILKELGSDSKARRVVIAYEPVWAISTVGGGEETPEDAARMIRYIQKLLGAQFRIKNSTVIYGGSVNAKNSAAILGCPEIEGALVGAASLQAKNFLRIIHDAENVPPRAL